MSTTPAEECSNPDATRSVFLQADETTAVPEMTDFGQRAHFQTIWSDSAV